MFKGAQVIFFCATAGVRLVGGGEITYQGRVEVFYNGSWGSVCDYSWRLNEAHVVCRQLGFPGAVRGIQDQSFGTGKGKIWMRDVYCTGRESYLHECHHRGWGQTGDCSHSSDVGVVCIPGNC